ncbi:MAG: PaaI family thioesterase [Candidatus Dormibacteria bacterium]
MPGHDVAAMNSWGPGTLPGLLGIVVEEANDGVVVASLRIESDHLAPNGYLHAGAVVTLADTAAGYGTVSSLPEGRVGFTTIELKANFLGTATAGTIRARAERLHGGRTTQVWDATVRGDGGRVLAVFRCTQLLLGGPAQ